MTTQDRRFAKVPLDAIRWTLRNTRHTSRPPDAVMLMELAGLLVMGDLPSWTKRELARR